MSGHFHTSADHERAREFAAARIDGMLEPAEEAWLDEHLDACEPCAAVAADYATDHLLLFGLRDHEPQPPRDLWARTAAAIEAEGGHGRPAGRSAPRSGSRIGWALAPVAGLAALTVVMGSSLLIGQATPSSAPAIAMATPMTVTTADVQVLTRDTDGHYRISTRSVSEVCPVGAAPCEVSPSAESAPLAAVPGRPAVSEAILSPARDRLVVVQAADGGEAVFVIPVRTTPGAAGTASQTGDPGQTDRVAATPTDRPAATPVVTPGPDETAGGPDASATPVTPAGTDEPATSPPATEEPVATTEPAPVETPAASPATPEDPSAPASPDTTTDPVAATEHPSAAAETPRPSPSVEVTPGPDGAIRIADNVRIVGTVAAYNGPGTRFAFTARPADGSAGPDVYLWNTDESTAHPVTTDHRSVFAGWHEGHLVISRVGGEDAGTYLIHPSGAQDGGRVSDGWLPTISPDRTTAAWWTGDVRFAKDGVTPVTGAGELVLGPWEAEGGVKTLAKGPLDGWTVRWDPNGTVLAVWVAGRSDASQGRLSLYRMRDGGRTIDTENPLLEDEPAFSDFGLDEDHLAWRATGKDATPVVRVMAWQGDDVGIVELPAEAGSSIVH